MEVRDTNGDVVTQIERNTWYDFCIYAEHSLGLDKISACQVTLNGSNGSLLVDPVHDLDEYVFYEQRQYVFAYWSGFSEMYEQHDEGRSNHAGVPHL